jgi:hypothetical protein
VGDVWHDHVRLTDINRLKMASDLDCVRIGVVCEVTLKLCRGAGRAMDK